MTPSLELLPAPGSDAALELGCTCPRLDNNHGAGVMLNGERIWWYAQGCPVHGAPIDTEKPA